MVWHPARAIGWLDRQHGGLCGDHLLAHDHSGVVLDELCSRRGLGLDHAQLTWDSPARSEKAAEESTAHPATADDDEAGHDPGLSTRPGCAKSGGRTGDGAGLR